MLSAIVRTVIVYIVVIFAMRLMGKRQLGELQPAELVTTILISNVASICVEEPELPLLASLGPIFLIAALEILNSTAAWYCPRYAGVLFGRPVTVVRDGSVDQQALAHLRITAADLAEALRGKDVFSPQEVAWGVIETNGTLSIARKPAPGQPGPMLPVVIDGQLFADNLRALRLDTGWLAGYLAAQAVPQKEVLLLLHDGQTPFLLKKQAAPQRERPGKDTL